MAELHQTKTGPIFFFIIWSLLHVTKVAGLFTTLGKVINSIDIIVWELTQFQVLQRSSYVFDIVWVLWCISLGKLSMDSNCVCLLWYFQSLSKCQMLYHLNYLVSWFWYEWLLTLSRIVTQLLCMFVFDSGQSLPVVRSYEIQIMSCFSWLGFRSSWLKADWTHTLHYLYTSFRACLVR